MSSQQPGDPYAAYPFAQASSYEQPVYDPPPYEPPAYQETPAHRPTYPPPPYQPWVGGYPIQPIVVMNPPPNGKAIASMVLGICLALTFCSFSLFSPIAAALGLGTGIPAVILGHMALKQIKASSGTQGGQGMAIAGLVLGYISIATGVFAAALSILFFILFSQAISQPV